MALVLVGEDDEVGPVTEIPQAAAADGGRIAWRIAGYQVIDKIAEGGMGIIYRASHPQVKRVVALKCVAGFSGDAGVARFRAEVEAAAGLDHPNIVPIYEIGEHDGRPFFTMRLLEGSLEARLEEFVPGGGNSLLGGGGSKSGLRTSGMHRLGVPLASLLSSAGVVTLPAWSSTS